MTMFQMNPILEKIARLQYRQQLIQPYLEENKKLNEEMTALSTELTQMIRDELDTRINAMKEEGV